MLHLTEAEPTVTLIDEVLAWIAVVIDFTNACICASVTDWVVVFGVIEMPHSGSLITSIAASAG